MTRKILIVEDHKEIAELLELHLRDLPCEVVSVHDGVAGMAAAETKPFDLVILDLMLPGLGGLEILKRLRAKAIYTPVLVLTSKTAEIDRVLGLELGADDYVTKPFSITELVARVKAIMRRVQSRPSAETGAALNYRDLIVDPEKRKVTLGGRRIELTHHEFNLLHALMAAPGKVFTRDELLSRLYPKQEAIVIDRVVDVHIGKIRQKIEKDPSNPAFIFTVRGSGYRFAEEEGGDSRNAE